MRTPICLLLVFSLPLMGGESTTATVNVQTERVITTIPADFMGLSYEKTAIAEKHFRPDNNILINFHRNLGDCVLRIGANKVEHCKWQSSESNNKDNKDFTLVTPTHVDQFYAFTKAINWKVIYGVNLASNDPANSAEEISYANKVGGKSTMAFEIGNEPDQYYLPPKKNYRDKGYNYAQYKNELSEALRVIFAKNPGVPIAGPANTWGGNRTFFAPCLNDFKSKLTLATSHAYPTSNKEPYPTIEKLLSSVTEGKIINMAASNMAVARKEGLPWRLAECNSTSLGGTAGVSDVYAAAIWGSDFLFDIAAQGAAGINFHTIFGTNGYTAIAYDKKTNEYSARPLYFSLLLFKDAGHGKLISTETKSTANVNAHATLGNDKKLRVVVINKDLTQAISAIINTGTSRTNGAVARLIGASPSERAGISYAEMTVNAEGKLTPQKLETVKGVAGKFSIELTPCSAAVLTIEAN